jgi:hypothetical protein
VDRDGTIDSRITARCYTACVAEFPSMGIKAPPAAARTWLSSSCYSPARSGRTRSLRAACRPCSRGPARRARGVARRRRRLGVPYAPMLRPGARDRDERYGEFTTSWCRSCTPRWDVEGRCAMAAARLSAVPELNPRSVLDGGSGTRVKPRLIYSSSSARAKGALVHGDGITNARTRLGAWRHRNRFRSGPRSTTGRSRWRWPDRDRARRLRS